MQSNSPGLWRLAISAHVLPVVCSILVVAALQLTILSLKPPKVETAPPFVLERCAETQLSMIALMSAMKTYLQTSQDSDLAACRQEIAGLDKAMAEFRQLSSDQKSVGSALPEMKNAALDFESTATKVIAVSQDKESSESRQLKSLLYQCEFDFRRFQEYAHQLGSPTEDERRNSSMPWSGETFYLLCAAIFVNVVAYYLTARLLTNGIARAPAQLKQHLSTAENRRLPLANEGFAKEILAVETQFSRLEAAILDVNAREKEVLQALANAVTGRDRASAVMREEDLQVRIMLDRMPMALLLVDAAGAVKDANDTALHLLSIHRELIVSRYLGEILPIPKKRANAEWLMKTAGNSPALLTLIRPGGKTHLEVRVITTTLEQNHAYILLLTDVTSKQKLEILRNQLLEGIAERIFAPLSSVNLVLNRLHAAVNNTCSVENLRYLAYAENESDRLLKLFSEFLEILYSNVRQLSLNRQEVSVTQLMDRAVAAAQITAEKKGISLTAEYTDIRLYADPERITQVLINLIFNALKFTERSGYVKLQAKVLGENTLELRVIDSGRGIPIGMEEKIFDPFKQTGARDSLEKGGSGLGLFICKSIVERHGGKIYARNHVQGAAFCVQLPMDDLKAQRLAEYENLRTSQAVALLEFERLDPRLSGSAVASSGASYEIDSSIEQRMYSVLGQTGAMAIPPAQVDIALAALQDAPEFDSIKPRSAWQGISQSIPRPLAPNNLGHSHLDLEPSGESKELLRDFTPTKNVGSPGQAQRKRNLVSFEGALSAVIAVAVTLISTPLLMMYMRNQAQQEAEAFEASRQVLMHGGQRLPAQKSKLIASAGKRISTAFVPSQPIESSAPNAANPVFDLTTLERQQVDNAILTGDELMRQDKPEQAAKIYVAAVTRFPHIYQLRIRAVKALIAAKEYSDARRLCTSSLENSPDTDETKLLKQLLDSIPK